METKHKKPSFLLSYLLPFILIWLLLSYIAHILCCNKNVDNTAMATSNAATAAVVSETSGTDTDTTLNQTDANVNTAAEVVEKVTTTETNQNDIEATTSITPVVVNFDSNQSNINLSDDQRNQLKQMADYVANNKDAKVYIVGHTDNRGEEAANQVLGKQRANVAANYLQQNGLSADALVVTSKGEIEPTADNTTDAGMSQNRRAEIFVK